MNAFAQDKKKLTYSSNNKKIAIDKKGKITVTVIPTGSYIYTASNISGCKMKITWLKNKTVDGYQI